MTYFIVQTLNGLFSAALLFLIASGLTMTFGVMRIVNIAHGSFYMLGAYVASRIVVQTHSLIASDRVEGTPVRRSGGEKIGTIERLMIDKISGNVAYAVLSFGGFLGIGQRHAPIPWAKLPRRTRAGNRKPGRTLLDSRSREPRTRGLRVSH